MLYVLCDPLSGNSAHTTLEYSYLIDILAQVFILDLCFGPSIRSRLIFWPKYSFSIDILPNWPLPHSKVFILDGHVGPYCTQKC